MGVANPGGAGPPRAAARDQGEFVKVRDQLRRMKSRAVAAVHAFTAPPFNEFPAGSPIDRYLASLARDQPEALFGPTYELWRAKRIRKIIEIYGIDFFAGKTVLELGSGHSDIGAFFAELGATVTCLEGRKDNHAFGRLRHRNVPRLSIELFDVERDFTAFGRFDLIIDMGLLYHVPDCRTHLQQCFAMSDEIILETVVCDSADAEKCVILPEDSHELEEALNGTGSRPTQAFVERVAEEAGCRPTVYATADLNVGDEFVYDWKATNSGDLGGWRNRRLWRLSRQGGDLAAGRSA